MLQIKGKKLSKQNQKKNIHVNSKGKQDSEGKNSNQGQGPETSEGREGWIVRRDQHGHRRQ